MIRKAFSLLLALAFILTVFFVWHQRNYFLSHKKTPVTEQIASLSEPVKQPEPEKTQQPQPARPEQAKLQPVQPEQVKPQQSQPKPQPVPQPEPEPKPQPAFKEPKITGDSEYTEIMRNALALIAWADREEYDFICRYIDEIRQVNQGSGIVPGPEDAHVVFYNRLDKDVFFGQAPVNLLSRKGVQLVTHEAGQIIHEAEHERLFLDGYPHGGEQAERQAINAQNAFLAAAGCPELCYDIEKQLQTRWWEVPYSQRNW